MKDMNRRDLLIVITVMGVTAVVLLLLFAVGGPAIGQAIQTFDEGLGLKAAAIWSFGISFIVFVTFAIVGGADDFSVMMISFFAFFVVMTFLIAWVF